MNCPSSDDFSVAFANCSTFVGRQRDIQILTKEWRVHRIFGIYGIRSVGKSRLAQEFVKIITKDEDHLTYIYADARGLTTVSALYTHLCIVLGMKPEGDACDLDSLSWIRHISRAIKINHNTNFIILFDNTEDYQDGVCCDSFLQLCTTLAQHCENIKIVITSTTKAQFSQLQWLYFSYELLPLLPLETLQLLRFSAPNVDLGEHRDDIVNVSEGLPLLVLMIGSEMSEDEGLLTPADMVGLLHSGRLKALSREFYPEEDRVADVYKKFIGRYSEVLHHWLAVLAYMPGSFTTAEARQMLDFPSSASVKDEVLIPIRHKNLLQYDSTTGRFSIQGILRECICSFYSLKNTPEIRVKYCQTFTVVMKTLSQQLGTEEYIKTLAEFVQEQPNLQKVLKEVSHANMESYHFFIEMATCCTELIERYMTVDCEEFYNGCLKVADMYGKDVDKAAVHISLGSLYTNIKCNLQVGAKSYKAALAILPSKSSSLQLAKVYQRMAWNIYQQGNHFDALGYLWKSLNISTTAGKEYEMLELQSLSTMGAILTTLGKFKEAEKYNFIALNRRKQILGPYHPYIGSNLNNIGVMYDQKGDSKNALKYFLEGLEIKRKSKATPHSFVASLSNVANIYTSLKQFDKAHELIHEAEQILNDQKFMHYNMLSVVYDTKGKTYMEEGRPEQALEMFEKSLNLREELIPDSTVYMETLVHKAQIYKLMEKYNNSVKIAKKALKMKDKVIKQMQQAPFIAECLMCLADVYFMTGHDIKHRETLENIESELLRLEQVHMCHGNNFKVESIRQQLMNVRLKLN